MSLFPLLVSETAVEAVQYFSQGYPLPPPLLSVTVVDILGSAAEAPSMVLIVSVFPYGMSELSVVLVGGFLGSDSFLVEQQEMSRAFQLRAVSILCPSDSPELSTGEGVWNQ